GGTRVRKAQIRARPRLPHRMESALRADSSYFFSERTVFHEPAGPLDVELFSEELFSLRGSITVTPLGASRCRCDLEGTCVVPVPLFGPSAEELIDEVRAHSAAAARLVERWIDVIDVVPSRLDPPLEHRLE